MRGPGSMSGPMPGGSMSLASLKSALEAAQPALRPGQHHYPGLFEADGITPQRHFPFWLVEPIAGEIEKTIELQRLLTNGLCTINSSRMISAWHIAQATVHRLLAGVAPDTIVSDVLDLAGADKCNNQTYVGIYGSGIEKRIDIDSDVAVMPAAMAPKSLARQLVFDIDRWDRAIFHPGIPRSVPNLAILVSQAVNPFQQQGNFDTHKVQHLEACVQNTIRALTLSSGCPFTRSWQASWIDHPSIPYDGIGGYAASGNAEEVPKRRPVSDQPVDALLAKHMYAAIDLLPDNVRAPIELATDRLRRSRVHGPSVDAALDLGVAGEIILLHPAADSELSYRFALRGAYLIAANNDDRKEKFEAFRAMYAARSRAAHTGTLNARHRARLAEFDNLCRAAICEIIERRSFPDWEDLVLGMKKDVTEESSAPEATFRPHDTNDLPD